MMTEQETKEILGQIKDLVYKLAEGDPADGIPFILLFDSTAPDDDTGRMSWFSNLTDESLETVLSIVLDGMQ